MKKDPRRFLVLFFGLFPAFCQATEFDYASLVPSFTQTLAAMVKADTSNPPGNEARIVALVAEKLKAAEIPYEIIPFAPGRENIVARLKGEGGAKPLLLMAHLDVVGVKGQEWTSDPHTMVEKNGYLVGRGVGDDLGMAALELEIFLKLKRDGVMLKRDVILALTGDEETSGLGIQYLLKHRPDLVNAGIALNEGGEIELNESGKVKIINLQTAEKTYQDFTISAQGTTGHSSIPLADNAIYRLARALDRLGRYQPPARLLPVTKAFFLRKADSERPKLAAALRKLAMAKGKLPVDALKTVESDPALSAYLRTTCIATQIEGGSRANALPASAEANINCRVLPDEPIAEIQRRLTAVVGDTQVKIKRLEEFVSGGSSAVDGELPAAVEKVAKQIWPGVPVIPNLSRWATDSRFLREKGVQSYGLDPIAMTESDLARAHGIDERIPVAGIRPALELVDKLVKELAARP